MSIETAEKIYLIAIGIAVGLVILYFLDEPYISLFKWVVTYC